MKETGAILGWMDGSHVKVHVPRTVWSTNHLMALTIPFRLSKAESTDIFSGRVLGGNVYIHGIRMKSYWR